MSTCISRQGEYSSHEPDEESFVCQRCFVFDEAGAMETITALRERVEQLEADALLASPQFARLIAAAEARGAAQVREAVEGVLPDTEDIRAEHLAVEARGEDCGCAYKDCYECGKWHNCSHGTAGLVSAIRAALAAETPTESAEEAK